MAKSLVVFSHVIHYKVADKVFAHGPYVKEIDVMVKDFSDLIVVAPVVKHSGVFDPKNNTSYSKRATLIALPVVGGDNVWKKLLYILYFPVLLVQIVRGVLIGEVLHPRAPGSVAFIALPLIAVFGRRKRKLAKFAGEWDSPAGLPRTYRLQKYWLSNRFLFNGPVFVYSSGLNPSHIIPSFTSSFAATTIAKANAIGLEKQLTDKLIVAFAGRLVQNKGVEVLLDALKYVDDNLSNWELLVFGDGIEMDSLKKRADGLGLSSRIRWFGWCSHEILIERLAEAHVVCQPTRFSESWGKVLQEGMAFGCIPVASAIGGLRRQLAERPELLFEVGNSRQCAMILTSIATGKFGYNELKLWSIEQSRKYSLGALGEFVWNKYNEYYASR